MIVEDVPEPSGVSFSGGGGGAGVPVRLGSSLSSMTKAASKIAGSGLGAPLSVISVEGFLARGRRPAALASLLRDEVEPDREGVALSPDFRRACSSAMVRSIAPRSLYKGNISQLDVTDAASVENSMAWVGWSG